MEQRCYRLLVAVLWQFAALLLAVPPSPALAQAQATHIAARLVARPAVAPGQRTDLVIVMTPAKGWHGYWLNPGDAGLGMTLAWTAPAAARIGQPRYPVPETLLVSGLMNHVYNGAYGVVVPLEIAADTAPGPMPIVLKARWLACTEEICVPESGELRATIRVASGPPAVAHDHDIDRWLRRLPAPLDAPVRFALAGETIRLGIPLPASVALADPHVFIAEDKLVDYAAPQDLRRKGDLLIVTLRRPRLAAAPTVPALSGVLRLNDMGDGIAFAAHPGAVPTGGTPVASGGAPKLPALPLLLLGALLGGLILNVMPCVFPILSLKALSLARAGESEAHARVEGLAYAAGVIAACLALGGGLLALRAAGEEVGWAFQLQEPVVIVALLLLAVGITANFLGAFEFAVPGFATQGSPQGAFATGLLAAFVATPCTGPFMATAMGAALLLPVAPALALFAALGLGIALPFLAVAFVPALRRRLPRPGAWMTVFRRWMALPMALTALALAWLAWRTAGDQFALAATGLAVMLVVILVQAGRAQRAGRPAAKVVLQLALLGAVAALILPGTVRAPTAATAGVLDARPFSETALADARASGKPVFVWFTADWCLTCKVNEEVAIEREETRAAFAKAGVIVLRGDWTRRDPEITRYLTAQGAAGVPLYMWYPASGGAPEQLPQVLTAGLLADKAKR
ncbi:protein-disulfide reductase DsbD family protein [Novosphingobium album (ex Liu et al. 2023)]|uniref:Protein-disulfide reductase DsbD family protein n=1 Tax=Novosphingobium album (ex Liu et al. 2023) TaxID=3031130 RepID=A0ABT5WMA5_9SPHN|nr:thioredoxin family protein [Novosphingobium album (ex Liu et al. 2023)]MDE8651166.1 protein-disulfide reductase DsbD family protein [Novosphingobium album (ex Liu et al. 2023)]